MKQHTLARAISLSLAGAALSLGAASNAMAHTMYNSNGAYTNPTHIANGTDGGVNSTDGWVSAGGWVGTAGGAAPFGSVGLVTHWAGQLHSQGDSLEISSQDAFDHYGIWADIDTARGAWNDKGPNGGVGSQGWGHNTDVGLLKSDVTQKVTITPSTVGSAGWSNFGISVFTGMDTGSSYEHHGGWNVGYQPASYVTPNPTPAMQDNPLGTTGLTFLTFSDSGDVTFTAQAGQIYSILLGGYSGPDNYGPHAGYSLSITSAPVPVPAAVWLFGSALAGMGVLGRRKEKATA